MNEKTDKNSTREKGTLYVVATPIGNLLDISERAIKTLSEVSCILVEDTRVAAKLLQAHAIATATTSLHDYNEEKMIDWVEQRLLQGRNLALISDAGTPLVNDPGFKLVRALRTKHFEVSPIPGPSALIAALSCGGLPTDEFVFSGFLAAKAAKRQAQLQRLIGETRTLIFYESSHRIRSCLQDMLQCFGEGRQVVVAREMTKKFEQFFYGELGHVLRQITDDPCHQKGEFVILLSGSEKPPEEWYKAQQLMQQLIPLIPTSQASQIAAKTFDLNKNQLYQWALQQKNTGARFKKSNRENP